MMASHVQATRGPREPLKELNLHHFVAQSLATGSPKSSIDKLHRTPSRSRSPTLPRSRSRSVSVSPHKQAVMQNHRLTREGSVASPSTAADQSENVAEANIAVLPRRLFGDCTSRKADSDLSLEASPVLSRPSKAESRFSPRNVKNLAHHSPSRPSTPKGATTTPTNLRQHRPPHTTGPKPASFIEPSPSTQRRSEPRLVTSRLHDQGQAPTTPSRSRIERQSSPQMLLDEFSTSSLGPSAAAEGVTPLEEPTRSTSNKMLQSLPKKKHRVSPTEIAIAHEEAGAGPIVSPSPRKMTDYFSPAKDDVSAFGTRPGRGRADSISDRQSLATLQSLTELSSEASMDSLRLTKSGLFLGVVAKPVAGWTVFEDPVGFLSDDTAPSQDHPVSVANPFSSPVSSPSKHSLHSTPNKENCVPDAALFATKPIPIALPERTHSDDVVTTRTRSSSRLASAAPSPAAVAPRKRGTGGRLSLLADADDDEAAKDASVSMHGDESFASVPGSGKKARSRQIASTNASPIATRKTSSHQRKISAGSARSSRDPTSFDAVASRTRSRTRA